MITVAAIVDHLLEYTIGKGLDHVFRRKTENYRDRLTKVIDNTIAEYSKNYPSEDAAGKFPFWKSQIIIEELLKYRFFKNNDYLLDEARIKQELKANQNILPPKKNEITGFVEIFEEQFWLSALEILRNRLGEKHPHTQILIKRLN